MEVEEDSKPKLMATSAQGSISVSLHPLVIMNISEHWTRFQAQAGQGKSVRALGALIGKQRGRTIEVMNSFELVFDTIDGDIILDREYYNTKEEQFKQVFSDLDFLGWYTTGEGVDEVDIKVHKQVCEINESPMFLKLNTTAKNTDLPVNVYESVIDIINGEATMLFVELSYTLATEEAERIGLDHVAKIAGGDNENTSIVSDHLNAHHSAIKMLHSRVRLILQYIRAVKAGTLPHNHEVSRDIYSLCHRLPVLNTPHFKEDYYIQCNDANLMTYLGTITKGCNTINQFVNKFNVQYDRQGMGRRMRGLFF